MVEKSRKYLALAGVNKHVGDYAVMEEGLAVGQVSL